MTALAADRSLNCEVQRTGDYPVKASTLIYQGSLVGDSSGTARALVAADEFMGIALWNRADNSSGAASAINVKLATQGRLKRQSVTGASTVDDVGKKVYASDDNVLTLTSSSNSLIGKIDRFNTDDSTFDIFFQAVQVNLI